MSAATPSPTRIHSAPETPPSGDQTTRYMSVVQGATSNPRIGQSAELKAASTRLPNSHMAMIAKRGPSEESKRKKQHIRDPPHRVGKEWLTISHREDGTERRGADEQPNATVGSVS